MNKTWTINGKVKPLPEGTIIREEKVDHPSHYNRPGSMECIDEMVLVFGIEATKHFCLLNSWKYRYRAADKNGAEDLKKSDWYLAKYKELCGASPVYEKYKSKFNFDDGYME